MTHVKEWSCRSPACAFNVAVLVFFYALCSAGASTGPTPCLNLILALGKSFCSCRMQISAGLFVHFVAMVLRTASNKYRRKAALGKYASAQTLARSGMPHKGSTTFYLKSDSDRASDRRCLNEVSNDMAPVLASTSIHTETTSIIRANGPGDPKVRCGVHENIRPPFHSPYRGPPIWTPYNVI